MDDIQFLRGKETIQESFFHTFNDLHNASRQIGIGLRPAILRALADRGTGFARGCNGGLAQTYSSPARETRRAILEAKAREMGALIPDEVLDLLAERFPGSIRDMEGALNRVCAYADLTGCPIDLALAERSLGDLLTTPIQAPPAPEIILALVCEYYGVDVHAVVSKRRDRKVTLARQVAIYLLRERAQLPLKRIGPR